MYRKVLTRGLLQKYCMLVRALAFALCPMVQFRLSVGNVRRSKARAQVLIA